MGSISTAGRDQRDSSVGSVAGECVSYAVTGDEAVGRFGWGVLPAAGTIDCVGDHGVAGGWALWRLFLHGMLNLLE